MKIMSLIKNRLSVYLVACLFVALGIESNAYEKDYIFCRDCITDTTGRVTIPNTDEWSLVEQLQLFEEGINIDDPEKSDIPYKIKGSGSTSLGITIASIPGKLVRRLPGFYTFADASDHIHLIHTYRQKLHQLGVETTDTQLVALESNRHTWGELFYGGQGVVYVIQPYLKGKRLAENYLEKADEEQSEAFFKEQSLIAEKVFEYNKKNPGNEVTLDIVLNNWEVHFTGKKEYTLRLNDLAQPLYNEDGKQAYDWYDQASSLISPLHWDAQKELKKHIIKLLHPREFLISQLWGYDVESSQPKKHILSTSFENCSAQSQNCTPESQNQEACGHYPYPHWAMESVNDKLKALKLDPLTGEAVYLAFLNNNYAISCLRLYRRLSHSLRNTLSYIRLSNPVHPQKPESAPVNLYQTDGLPSYWECYRDPDIKYHPSPR